MGSLDCLNVGCGDASVIRTATGTFLVDCHRMGDFSSLLPSSKSITGVFVTHQHSDHYSGLNYLKDNGYTIGCLIYSPYDRRRDDASVTLEEWNEFNALKSYFSQRGTKLFAPFRQDSFSNAYWATDGIRFEILAPHSDIAAASTREIHDGCLVVGVHLGSRRCLFAGDASDTSLNRIAHTTSDFCNDILHASHHGSLNGADLDFIKKSNPKHVLVSTASGVYENVPHPTALQRYRNHTQFEVRRTDIDGWWTWSF